MRRVTIQPNPTAPLWPTEWQGSRIMGRFLTINGTPVVGTVTFTPTTQAVIAGASKTIIIGSTITVPLNGSGAIDVIIPATDDPDTNPSGFTYTVTENFPGGRTYSIAAPANATQDMTTLVPVATSNGVAITRGEAGPAGPEGPAGPPGTLPGELFGAGGTYQGAWVQQDYPAGSVVAHVGKVWATPYGVDAAWGITPGDGATEWVDVSAYSTAESVAELEKSANTSAYLPASSAAISPLYHHFVSGNIVSDITWQMPNVSDRSFWSFDVLAYAPNAGKVATFVQNAVQQVPIRWPGGATVMPPHVRETLYRFTYNSGGSGVWIAEIVDGGSACSDIGGMGGLPGRLRRGRQDTIVEIGEYAIIGIFLERPATITRVTTDFYNITGTGGRYHSAIYARPGLLTVGNLVATLPDLPCSNADVSLPANVTLRAGHYWLVTHLDGEGTLTGVSNRRPSYYGIIGRQSNQGRIDIVKGSGAWPGSWPTSLTGVSAANNFVSDQGYEYGPVMLDWTVT